jgi:hypothetical protein
MGRGFTYSPGIRVYGLIKTTELQDTKSSHLHLRGGSFGAYKREQKYTQNRGGKKIRKEATWNIEV